MLPTTFAHDEDLRISKQVIGIFAIAILAAGFSFTGLLAFAVRNTLFTTESVYIPALVSCIVGFLTIFYSFIISKRFYWGVPAYLTIVVAILSMLGYGGLLFLTRRKTHRRPRSQNVVSPPAAYRPSESTSRETLVPRYQDSAYYDNYIANMFPASANTPPPQQTRSGYDPDSISEEEMQRQQMLMLLLQQNQPSAQNASQSTFRIDWQDQEQEENAPPAHGYHGTGSHSTVSPTSATPTPTHGYYAPGAGSNTSGVSVIPLSSLSSQFSDRGLRPWDGVWRDPVPATMQAPGRVQVAGRDGSGREERRRQIESGR